MSGDKGYKLLDSGNFRKLEQVGPFRVARPSAQAVWRPALPEAEWQRVDAEFHRFSGGNGKWTIHNKKVQQGWKIAVPQGQLKIQLTDFGHLGIFPEQEPNWRHLTEITAAAVEKSQEFKVLNLFAYTGGASLAAAKGGAHVAHVDASKTSVAWARDNAAACGLAERPIRWLVEDVTKFVEREVRRGTIYDGIILDPPSFGRGPKGQAWKIEDHLHDLLDLLAQIWRPVHSGDGAFGYFLLSAHSHGYTPLALQNLLQEAIKVKAGKLSWSHGEMTVSDQSKRPLPSGAFTLCEWQGS